jgi:hypothetical protein
MKKHRKLMFSKRLEREQRRLFMFTYNSLPIWAGIVIAIILAVLINH